MELEMLDEPGIFITHIDEFGLPEDPTLNLSGIALQALLNDYTSPVGFRLTIEKKIKPGSGLGSSAAAAAGAVIGANFLLNNFYSKEELVEFAMEGEKIASGVKHADNLAPCIYGGVTLIRSLEPIDIIPMPSPELFVTVVHPQIEVKTSEARNILPKNISLKDATTQWANVAGLIAGFYSNNIPLIGRSLVDVIIEPARAALIPGLEEVKRKCMEHGAVGGGISGSGPSIFMFSQMENVAWKIEKQMMEIYTNLGIPFKTYVTTINPEGVKIISSE